MPWSPLISAKQASQIRDKSVYKLVDGPRKASKSIGCLNELSLHAWETDRAAIAMVGRTTTDNYDGGAWTDLVNVILPQWFNGLMPDGSKQPFGMKWIKEPKMDFTTHKIICSVTNKWGNESRIQLDSLKDEDDVERKFKGKRYSMIYVPELSNFKMRTSFDTWQECLRCLHLKPEQHSFIGDTNPPKEGMDSWIYQFWYVFRLKNLDADPELKGKEGLKMLQKMMSVHHYSLFDNIWMTDEERSLQEAKYAHDPDLYARYVMGEYRKASGSGLFSDVFRPNIHIIGDAPTSAVPDPDILVPQSNCGELGQGWDIGGVNKAAVIVEPYLEMRGESEQYCFSVLDEFVEIGKKITVAAMTEEMEQKMTFWEAQCKSKIYWIPVADLSSFEKYNDIADTYEHKEVYAVSEGRIELVRGPKKGKHTVQGRVNLLRKLLFNNRLYVSARCPKTIEMLQMIKAGSTTAIDRASEYKHVFDALTYYLVHKCYPEMEAAAREVARANIPPATSAVTSVQM